MVQQKKKKRNPIAKKLSDAEFRPQRIPVSNAEAHRLEHYRTQIDDWYFQQEEADD